MKKRLFFFNAVILTLSSFFLRFIGIGFRTFLSGKLGASGLGLYQLIFSVFMAAVTISTSGISLVVTRIVSEAIGRKKMGTIPSSMRKCIASGLCISILVAGLLYFGAETIAIHLLCDARAAAPLQILAPGLPFMAVCACFKGFFLAARRTSHSACAEVLEQLATIGIVVIIFLFFSPDGLENATKAVMLGSTVGEVISCLYSFVLYKITIRKYQTNSGQKSTGILHSLVHIALPYAVSSTIKTLLSAAENLLIPFGLKKSGVSAQVSMEQYGTLQGMALPMLFFPSSLLISFSSLLIPEIAEAKACKQQQAITRTTSRAIQITLLFSLLIACLFFAFSAEIGETFYKSTASGDFLRVLSPLIPLMYLDSVVDGILKGLDQQINSMKYNFADSSLRVLLIYLVLPHFGLKGYIAILFLSTIFNVTLSIHCLLKVAQVQFLCGKWFFKPTLCGIAAVFLAKVCGLPFLWQLLLSTLLYLLLIYLCGSFSKEDFAWFKRIWKS